MKSVCVYCGSRTGQWPDLMPLAYDVGYQIAQSGKALVYGGSKIGLMGQLADGALAAQGHVIGVIPKLIFDYEVAHEKLSRLYKVENMHERKLKMMQLSDAFIALPGGFGTMDELNEIITWRQLKIHEKPIAILNYRGYYDHYIQFLRNSVSAGLISAEHLDMIIVADSMDEILKKLF